MKIFRYLFFIGFIFFFLFSSNSYATSFPEYDVGMKKVNLQAFPIYYVADESRSLTFENILSGLVPGNVVSSRFNIPLYNANHWFGFQLKNSSSKEVRRLVLLDEPFVDEVTIFHGTDGIWTSEKNGLVIPVRERNFSSRLPVFEVILKPGEKKSIYLTFFSRERVSTVGIKVQGIQVYKRYEQLHNWGHWLFFGGLFSIIVYNLFLLFFLRERLYLYYVLYAIALLIFVFIYSGYDLYWISNPSLHLALSSSIGISAGFMVLFLRALLNSGKSMPGIDRVLKGFFVFFMVWAGFNAIDKFFSPLIILAGMPITLISFGIVLYAFHKRIPLASYLAFGMGCYILGMFLVAAVNFGLVPYNIVTRYGYLLGAFIEAITFSLALVWRIRLIQTEKEAYQYHLLKAKEDASQILEEQVNERTYQLAKANETKDKFFSIIAHDLKGSIGNLSILFNDLVSKGSDINDDIFSEVQTSTRQTYQLLLNLLTWARSQQGELVCHPTVFSVSDVSEDILGQFQERANRKKVTLKRQFGDNIVVNADRKMVTTILKNIIDNAIKYTSDGDSVTCLISCQNNRVKISVIDTGIGLTDDIQAALFRPEKKLQSVMGTRNESGSGLGLILCSEFVKRNGGEIGCYSQIGKGSEFWFTLPQAEQLPEDPFPEEVDLKTLLQHLNILVVDDNRLHLNASTAVLKDLGIKHQIAIDGDEAVAKCKINYFDVLLMDIEMVRMDGIEAARRILNGDDNKPKIIALSSYSQKEIMELAPENLFCSYLNKPLEKTEFLEVLEQEFCKN